MVYDISNLPKPVELAFKKFEPSGESSSELSPIIIHHGIFSSKNSWLKPGLKIAEETKRTVYCVDCRDHGDSPKTHEFNYKSMISDSVHFCNQRNIEKAVFIGHSLGGLVYSRMATIFPDLLEKLVLVDIHPKKELKDKEGDTKNVIQLFCDMLKFAIATIQKEGITDLEKAKERLQEILQPFIKDENNRKEYGEKLTIRDGKIEWKFNLPELAKFLEEVKHIKDMDISFDGKVFEIFGSQSPFINRDDKESILKMLKNCKFHEIQGGDHANLQTTFFDEFIKHVVPFINDA